MPKLSQLSSKGHGGSSRLINLSKGSSRAFYLSQSLVKSRNSVNEFSDGPMPASTVYRVTRRSASQEGPDSLGPL